ncbi:MAG: cation:proton antiporter [Nitrososphaerota archaeon]|nr:cation:proton antiporter [Nitrososphaerota archaeon]
MDTNLVFLLVSVIIIVGFAGDRMFKKTAVPPFIFLILMGVFLGPIFHILSRGTFTPILGIFGELTLSMILFYAGLDTNLAALRVTGNRAFLQVFLYVIMSIIAITSVMYFLVHWAFFESLIFSSIIGGETTAVVVVPLSKSKGISENLGHFLVVETALNSILTVIFFFSFVDMYQTGTYALYPVVATIVANFSVSIVIGLATSLVWLRILQRFSAQRYTYVLTLGLLLLSFVAASEFGGTGIFAVVVFGLVLGNYKVADTAMGRNFDMSRLLGQLKVFQEEMSFLMTTLFFVFLGLMVVIDVAYLYFDLVVCLGLIGVLFSMRYIALYVSTHGTPMSTEKRVAVLFIAQGLTPATLSVLAYSMGLPMSNTYLALVSFVIVFTNIITTAGIYRKTRTKGSGFSEFMTNLGAQNTEQ